LLISSHNIGQIQEQANIDGKQKELRAQFRDLAKHRAKNLIAKALLTLFSEIKMGEFTQKSELINKFREALTQELVEFIRQEFNSDELSELAYLFVSNKLTYRTVVTREVKSKSRQFYIRVTAEELADVFKDTKLLKKFSNEKVLVRVFDTRDTALRNEALVFEAQLKKDNKSYSVILDRKVAEKLKGRPWVFVIEPAEVLNDVIIAVDTFKERIEAFERAVESGDLLSYKAKSSLLFMHATKYLALIARLLDEDKYDKKTAEALLLNPQLLDELYQKYIDPNFEPNSLLWPSLNTEEEINQLFDVLRLVLKLLDEKADEIVELLDEQKQTVREKFQPAPQRRAVKGKDYREEFEKFKKRLLVSLEQKSDIDKEKSERYIKQKIEFVKEFLEFCNFKVTEQCIIDFFNYIQFEKKLKGQIGVRKSTFDKYKTFITAFLKDANPSLIYAVKSREYTAGHKELDKCPVLSVEDIRKLIRDIQAAQHRKLTEQDRDELVGLVLLLAVSGMRQTEAMRLRVSDIFFDNRVVILRKEITKKEYSRYAFITTEVRDYLLSTVVRKYNKGPDDPLFNRNLWIFNYQGSNDFKTSRRLKESLKIDFNLSCLRKFYVSMLQDADTEQKELIEALRDLEMATAGHKSELIVRKHYSFADMNIESVLSKNELRRLRSRQKVYDSVFEKVKFLTSSSQLSL